MQEVSNEWKSIHDEAVLNETFVEVSLDIADPDALKVAEAQDNGAIYISNSSELTNGVDKTPEPYTTLEQNMWCLDGKRKSIPESNFGDASYASDVLSDDTCMFNPKVPIMTITFKGQVFTKDIPGVTITWSSTYGEWADTFTILAYNGNNIVAEKEVLGNKSVKSLVPVDITNYDKIVIIIKKWCLPNHRARVEEIFVGLRKVYGKADLFDYSHSQSVDRLSGSLPKSEITFSINNINGEYNPYNTSGLSKYLMERQEIKSRYGMRMRNGSIEWIDGGTFYLSEWYAKQNGMTADFRARDLLEFMSGIYYDTVTSVPERTLYELATSVLQSAELPRNSDGTVKWVIDESLKSIKTKAPLPVDTRANCLQLIAHAAGLPLYQDRGGTLHISPEPQLTTYHAINSFNSYMKPEITLTKPIKEVKIKVYTYTKGDKGFESTTREISHSSWSILMGETITIDNPLITDEEVSSLVAQKWFNYFRNERKSLEFSWRPDVSLDALDIIQSINEYNRNQVRMSEVTYKFNGAFTATGKGKVIGDG